MSVHISAAKGEIAKKIIENLDLSKFSNKSPEIAGPGFINIFLSNEAFFHFGYQAQF